MAHICCTYSNLTVDGRRGSFAWMYRVGLGVFFVLGLTCQLVAQPAGPPGELLRIPPGTDAQQLQHLIDSPELIDFVFVDDPQPDTLLSTTGDMHGVFDVSLQALRAAITDFSHYPEFVPRAVYSAANQLESSPDVWRHHMVLSFQVLFFGRDYETISSFRTISNSLSRQGAEGYMYELIDSVDGQLSDMRGTWYLEPVEIDGRTMTYVRYTLRTDYTELAFGQEYIMKRFSQRELRATIRAFVDRGQALQGGTQ